MANGSTADNSLQLPKSSKYYVYGRTEANVQDELLNGTRSNFFLENLDDIDKFAYRGVIDTRVVDNAPAATAYVKKVDEKQNLVYIFSGFYSYV